MGIIKHKELADIKKRRDTGEAGEWKRTWLAVAVAKGTLVADVEAADTLAGVAPCIMGTWRGRDHTGS